MDHSVVVQEILSACKELLDQKIASEQGLSDFVDEDELEDRVSEIELKMIDLKDIQHEVFHKVAETEEKTQIARREIDKKYIEFKSLEYRRSRMEAEIDRLLNPEMEHLNKVDLITNEQFKIMDPKLYKQTNFDDENDVILKKLEVEMKTRQRLANDIKDMITRNKGLEQNIKDKKKWIDSLPAQLAKVQNAMKPLITHVKDSDIVDFHENTSNNHSVAAIHALPGPLYTAFVQLEGYRQSIDSRIGVKIVDSVIPDFVKNESDAFMPSPQAIILSVNTIDSENKEAASIIIMHYPNLRLVTSRCTVPSQLPLDSLYPNDTGLMCPNPFAAHNPEVIKTTTPKGEFAPFLYDRPFSWVQYLCGLDFLPPRVGMNMNSAEPTGRQLPPIERSVQAIVKRIRDRVQQVSNFRATISTLKQLEYPIPVSETSKRLFPSKTPSKAEGYQPYSMVAFAEDTSGEDFDVPTPLPSTSTTTEEGEEDMDIDEPKASTTVSDSDDIEYPPSVLQKNKDRVFNAVFNVKGTNSTSYRVTINVPHMYPLKPSTVELVGLRKGGGTQVTDDTKCISNEVNCFYNEFTPRENLEELFPNQLRRIQECLELSEGLNARFTEGPQTFRRGKDRRLPMKYDVESQQFVHRE